MANNSNETDLIMENGIYIQDKLIWQEVMSKDIMMKTIQTGSGTSAEMNTIVTCDYSLFVVKIGNPQDDVVDDVYELVETAKAQRYQIGQSDCVPVSPLILIL